MLLERQAVTETLVHGELTVVGRVLDASNTALLVSVTAPGDRDAGDDPAALHAIYKPVRGERPLWDFPEGTLAGREVATALVADALGCPAVPPTVLRDGPYGPGSVQAWIGDPFTPVDLQTLPVRVVEPGAVDDGWLRVVDGELADGTPVTVVHEDCADLRAVAVLDAVVNNADRKGSHLVRDAAGALWGFDHGLTCHREPKLRTVLWGWAGRPLPEAQRAALTRLAGELADPHGALAGALATLLPAGDLAALGARVRALAASGRHPLPGRGWPSIPWPAI